MRETAAMARSLRAGRFADLRLGLIGDDIRASRAPELHRLAGRQAGLVVAYDLLIPPVLELTFQETLDSARAAGLAGVNVTRPYKEQAFACVAVDDPAERRIGAVNSIRFGPGGARGRNTDHSGFLAAWAERFGDRNPGRAALIGAGGVGRAIGFALVALGADIRIADADPARADGLAEALSRAGGAARALSVEAALAGADGVLNCTPLGMDRHPGSPTPPGAFSSASWAFDAVYTPEDTPFSRIAKTAGAAFLPGRELFFHQGFDAFAFFSGAPVRDAAALRRAMKF